ncbi:persephin [Acomys russatus]|uniref:persephin n=1 Tax=Acomys russatus TaxID=60746 RepID=UPI0021E297F6|nr:persephin [Acomys russatus]
MAAGRCPIMFLLLLCFHLGLGWVAGAHEAPVADELSPETAETGGTQKLHQGNKHVRLPRAPAGPCQLWSLTLPVAELGLGYASEEKVIFRYCAGSCPREARTQHSLVLARLRGQGRAHGRPCCQATSYADVTFLDDRHRWQRLPQLSAAACGCGG